MSDATGTVTTNYGFKTLDDGDRAGYTGINEIVTSIDTNLANDTFVADMIVLYPGCYAPDGWVDINTTIVWLAGFYVCYWVYLD
jgi:hypothetical protein